MKDEGLKESKEGDSLSFKDGEVIFEENSFGQDIYIIESGKVEISRHIGRVKTTIAVLERGAFFGEMAPITESPRSATATAVGNVHLTSLSMNGLIQRMQSNSDFMVAVLQRLTNRLKNTTTKMGSLAFRMYALGENSMEGFFPEIPWSLQDIIHSLKEQLDEKQQLLNYYQSPWWQRWFRKGQKKGVG